MLAIDALSRRIEEIHLSDFQALMGKEMQALGITKKCRTFKSKQYDGIYVWKPIKKVLAIVYQSDADNSSRNAEDIINDFEVTLTEFLAKCEEYRKNPGPVKKAPKTLALPTAPVPQSPVVAPAPAAAPSAAAPVALHATTAPAVTPSMAVTAAIAVEPVQDAKAQKKAELTKLKLARSATCPASPFPLP